MGTSLPERGRPARIFFVPCAMRRDACAPALQYRFGADAQSLDRGAAEQDGADRAVLRRRLPGLQPVLDPVGVADEAQLVHELVWYRCDGLRPATAEEGVLDLRRRILVAVALGEVVVEILGPRAHAADVQREFRLDRVAAGLEVVARSEEHTSELQSLMRISYAVF